MPGVDGKCIREIARELEVLAERGQFFGRNDLLGWVLLGRGLVSAHPTQRNPALAVQSILQARAAFGRVQPRMGWVEESFYRRAVACMDANGPMYEHTRQVLSRYPEDLTPPDWRP